MLPQANTYRFGLALVAAAALLGLPGLAAASTGGGGIAPTDSTQSGNRTVTATANGVTITTRISGFTSKSMKFTGSARRGATVTIQREGRQTGGRWVSITHAKVGSNGTFLARWMVNHSGAFVVRAVLGTSTASGPTIGGGAAASAWPAVQVILYKVAIATIYGPGFWGSQTACGEKLHRSTMGVANRTLPCGTPISLYYGGRIITVPVIDRGPYANHADWDLTEATAKALHMQETENVGAAALPRKK